MNPDDATVTPLPEMLILHHAGGSAIAYRNLEKQLGGKFRTLTLDLPGRGAAYGRKPCRSVREAVAFCLDALDAQDVLPDAVFGHSMGALIAFELASELERRGTPVTWLGLSAARPPGFPHPARTRRDLWDDAQLLNFVRDLGGTPEELLEDPDYVDYLLEVIRPDLELVDTYMYDSETPLNTPAEIYQGHDDPVLEGVETGHWEEYFQNSVTGRTWPGGHFYLFGSEGELATAITTSFDRALERKAWAPQQEASGPDRQEKP
ncbi:thioesterase [Streptomyces misionensis]|uniref:Thioesterase n=1 Tax=Streptomyces misionensis TaxID=67331 RepID=A0A5C6JXB4_9ACTN|nr:alpha/beta fold hydrolase [Streptomyces misionensis]TWV53486.1 thioesterase [Streptomyces misionensis]